MIEIKKYNPTYAPQLKQLMLREGEEWTYTKDDLWTGYETMLAQHITYVAFENTELCGFARCLQDGILTVYVCDLLVDKTHRGKQIGHMLMRTVCEDYPTHTVYAMSDVDAYYEKQGYKREGSIFEVCEGGV